MNNKDSCFTYKNYVKTAVFFVLPCIRKELPPADFQITDSVDKDIQEKNMEEYKGKNFCGDRKKYKKHAGKVKIIPKKNTQKVSAKVSGHFLKKVTKIHQKINYTFQKILPMP